MKNINQYILLMVATVALLFTACDEDDNTGFSSVVPSTPTISVDVSAGPISLVEMKSTFEFDVTLSEAQVTDIALYISVVEGATATVGDDFTIDNGGNRVYIPAGKTTGTVSITVLEDELLEETETFTIQIGDEKTANATIDPVTVDFTLQNLTGDDLVAGLSWETDVKDVIGLEVDPDEVVDLRFLVLDAAGAIVKVEDGGSFEHYTFDGADLADGVYTLAVDIYSAVNYGDINEPLTLDLALQFDQVGTINAKTFNFDGVMTNELTCDSYRTNLATVTKTGASYVIEEALSYFSKDDDPLVGTWTGDDESFPSVISTQVLDHKLQIQGLNNGWMTGFWEEEVIAENFVNVEVNWCAGTFTIPEQDYFTTLYSGDEYPYQIFGSGTFSTEGGVTTMTVKYELLQDGWNVNEYCYGKGYIPNPTFVATITLD